MTSSKFGRSLFGGLLLALIVPASALAATVTLTADTTVVLPSDGSIYTLSSGGTFDQLAVSAGTMTFTMSAGESVTITGGVSQALTNDGGFAYTCGSPSTLTLSASSNITVNVTPASGGCGGGSSTSYTTYSITGPPTTPIATTTPAAPVATSTPAAPASGLTSTQIAALLSLLASFHADQSIIAKVSAELNGQATSSATKAGAPTFARDLKTGDTGTDVRALQTYLDTHGSPVAASGPGSTGQETEKFGALTKAALATFQAAHGISPAAGYFGPLTRAYLAAHP